METQKTVLVVDDMEINRSILINLLKKDGFKTMEASNGLDAFEILKRAEPHIALVLLDLSMSVMNGYTLMDKMRESGILPFVPVIVMTGGDKDNNEILSLKHGASDFITMPYKADVVCHRIRNILRLRENAVLLNRMETDRLTGVYSREFFYEQAQTLLKKYPDQKYDIVCSNIENFKLINAKYGIEVGDELLRYIGQYSLKHSEENEICGRLGADSFVSLRKRRESIEQEEIGEMLASMLKDAPVKNFVLQYGLYQIEDTGISISDMCDCAQLALSTIKRKYGIYYAVYDDSMRQRMLREHQLSDLMDQALKNKEFVVYLQSKHDIETGTVAGAEALVRWIHPELGFISPGEFIPLFERNGFITKLDQYMLEETCGILNNWKRHNRKLIPISVNLSRVDFEDTYLLEKIGDLIEQYDISTEYIHFEVTESAYTNNPRQMIDAVSTLRNMGFSIEMDDFGSGYSSLNMLSELPIDILKLDMRFMQGENGFLPNGKRSILSFILSLFKWLQVPTIAEGVETKEDVELLKVMGCDYIQGYYFSKPLPVKEFEQFADDVSMQDNRNNERDNLKQIYAQPEEKIGQKPLILVVDDIKGNRDLIKNTLEDYYTIAEAEDGEKALEFIQKHHMELKCILLDLLMPVMDGLQLMDIMHKNGLLQKIPVIITSEAGADSELRALHLGADGFVAKPYNAELLTYHVKKAVDDRYYHNLCKEIIRK